LAPSFITNTPALYEGSKLERFFEVEENTLAFKTHWATRGVVNFYSAGVVTHDRRLGCWIYYLPE
jgi:hypothetical protein